MLSKKFLVGVLEDYQWYAGTIEKENLVILLQLKAPCC